MAPDEALSSFMTGIWRRWGSQQPPLHGGRSSFTNSDEAIEEAHAATESGLNRVGSNYDLCFAFLAHTGLPL